MKLKLSLMFCLVLNLSAAENQKKKLLDNEENSSLSKEISIIYISKYKMTSCFCCKTNSKNLKIELPIQITYDELKKRIRDLLIAKSLFSRQGILEFSSDEINMDYMMPEEMIDLREIKTIIVKQG